MNEELESHIEDVMDHFDFYRVKKVMDHLNWKWDSAEGCVPDIAEIRKLVRNLMGRVYHEYHRVRRDNVTIGTGGFYVTYNGLGFIVRFELESWESHIG
jgi:hypothetical protein